MLHKRFRPADDAIKCFREAVENDPSYSERAYFHADFAGALFEAGDYEEAAERYSRAIELGKEGIYFALHADALIFLGRYGDAREQLAAYMDSNPGPEGAEWRLKARTLDLIVESVGTRQLRDPEAAQAVMAKWSFEDGPDMPFEAAWESCEIALTHDACCGEAWFRLALLAAVINDDPTKGERFGVAGAVLIRHSPAQWSNAVLYAPPDDEETLLDLFYAGYHLNGNAFVTQVAESIREAPHLEGHRAPLTALLERAVVAADNADVGRFILRYKGADGEMREVEFGPDDQSDLAEPAAPANMTWQPPPRDVPRSRARSTRKKRAGKTHGRKKKPRRRK